MKKIKHFAFALALSATALAGLFSCSNEEVDQFENGKKDLSVIKSSISKNAQQGLQYAQQFYGTNVELGNSIDLPDPDSGDGVRISEVIVGGDIRARGYILSLLSSDEFLYFIDVNRMSNVMRAYSVSTGQLEVFGNLMDQPNYLASEKFDFIKYAPKNIAAKDSDCGFWKKLFGTCTKYSPPTKNPNGDCTQQVYTVRYIAFEISSSYGHHMVTGPCDQMHK